METRKKVKRRISFSSSSGSSGSSDEESEGPAPKTVRVKVKQIQPESADELEGGSGASSELSEAPSLAEVADDDEDVDIAEDDDYASDEDEEAIIESILQPQIDTSKKTARQKAKETGAIDHLEFLPIDRNSKAKPILTEEELALKKSENARKRKNQNEKKLDEEKQETINRLLNKQASKRKGAVKQLTAADTANLEEAEEAAIPARKTRPLPLGMIRYITNKDGSTVSLPNELIGHVVTKPLFGDVVNAQV